MKRASLTFAYLFAVSVGSLSGCIISDEGLPQPPPPVIFEPTDAGFLRPDAGPTDGGPAPTLPTQFNNSNCNRCTMDTDCPGGACLTTQAGERFCAEDCSADLNGCPEGFQCFDLGNEQLFCVPPGATCTTPGLGFGTSCFDMPGTSSATGCLLDLLDNRRPRCEGDGVALGYCTQECSTGSCPPGFSCQFGDDDAHVCQADYLSEAERCGRPSHVSALGSVREMACSGDLDCEQGVCIRTEPELPGVCAQSCSRDDDCPGDQSCENTGRGFVCLSARCSCHALALELGERGPDLMELALSQVGLTRCGLIFDVHDWAAQPADVRTDPYRLNFYGPIHNEPLRAPAWGEGIVEDMDGLATSSAAPSARAARMVERIAGLLDRPPVRLDVQLPGTLDSAAPLVSAVAQLIEDTGGNPDLPTLTADAEDIDLDLQLSLASVIDAIRRAHLAREAALVGFNGQQLYDFGAGFVAPRRDGRVINIASDAVERFLNEQFEYGVMYSASVDVLNAIAEAELERFANTATTAGGFLFIHETPIGKIAISDSGDNDYNSNIIQQSGAWALLLDLGGNDSYRVPAGGNVSFNNSVSVLIDLSGEDSYGYVEVPDANDTGSRLPSDGFGRYIPGGPPDQDFGPFSFSETPRQGGARLGTAVLLDLGQSNDNYRSLRMSQGSGIFGAGVLIDDGGDDLYELEAMGHGAGSFGIGLHLDMGGSDRRVAYTFSQGFGYARGGGLLYDTDGDDCYLMNTGDPSIPRAPEAQSDLIRTSQAELSARCYDGGEVPVGDPIYFSAQRPGTANSTLGQGFAFGRRGDLGNNPDRIFQSGGIGILIDNAGRDTYEGSIFAQGGGFWFGTGILSDRSGDDRYDSMWYGMGSGAHYALGMLLEGGGDDVYGGRLPRVNQTVGGPHDYSVAFLIDESGNDMYYGSRVSLGTGGLNSIGILIDNQGDDLYDAIFDYSVGNAGHLSANEPGNPRRKVKTIGLFIDALGQDMYTLTRNANTEPAPQTEPFEGVGNHSFWTHSQNMDEELVLMERGSGVDSDGNSTIHLRTTRNDAP